MQCKRVNVAEADLLAHFSAGERSGPWVSYLFVVVVVIGGSGGGGVCVCVCV